MVRWLTKQPVQGDPNPGDTHYVELSGLSTDDKPVGAFATGSTFFEVDTTKVFFYDEEGDTGKEWIEAGGTSGGGS